MEEKRIEQKLRRRVKEAGGMALKFVSPGYAGMPDRIILFSGGRVGFVEVKALGKQPRALQLSRHEELKALGFLVFVLDNDERIGEIIDEIRAS